MCKSRSKSFSSCVRALRVSHVSVLTSLSLLFGLGGGIVGVAGVGPAAPAGAAVRQSRPVPTPTVQGPILPSSGISYLGSTTFAPSAVGYEQSEFFLSGTATAYKSSQPLTKDGKWHVTPQTTAPYTTRVVVYRPIDPSTFRRDRRGGVAERDRRASTRPRHG